MNTPTPTPRTDAAVKLTFAAGHNTVCPNFARTLERELTALTAERDHLHAELRALTLICGTNDANKFETWVDRANARADRAEAAETVALAHWNKELERAMKAEAELAAAKERLRSEAMDDYASIKDLQRELAIERARLDWLESPSGMDWQWEPERLTVSRASIDAAMKEDAK